MMKLKKQISVLSALSLGLTAAVSALSVPCPVCAESDALSGYEYTVEGGSVTITGAPETLPADVVIPSEIAGLPVTAIGNGAFREHGEMTAVTVPEGVTAIGEDAFTSCHALKTVSLPDSLTSLGDSAFCYCTALEGVNIPAGLTAISAWAFEETALTEITLPAHVTSIGQYAFYKCANLDDVTVLNPNAEIFDNKGTFTNAYYTFSGTVHGYTGSTAQAYADKYRCKFEPLDKPEIPTSGSCGDGLTWAFDQENGALTVAGSGRMNAVPWRALKPQIRSVTLPDGLTKLAVDAFSDCTVLEQVTLPADITEIPAAAFQNCTALKAISIPDSVTAIGANAFSACGALTGLTLPAELEFIGYCAFLDCAGLRSITVPKTVTTVAGGAFGYCTALEEITFLNPDAEIAQGIGTVSSTAEGYSGIIRGYADSTAQSYAEDFQYTFESLGKAPELPAGDLNGNGKIEADDAQCALMAYVNKLADKANSMTDRQRRAADIDGDGEVTATDAQIILRYYVNRLAGKDVTWEELLPKK